jgi:hypothetical protein
MCKIIEEEESNDIFPACSATNNGRSLFFRVGVGGGDGGGDGEGVEETE